MLRNPVELITGASGEIGHGLIERIAQLRDQAIITLDLRALDPEIGRHVQHQYLGSVLDVNLLERILAEFEVDLVFHLAALLSTRGEFAPTTAHQVNVEGTLRMLDFAQKEGESHGRPVVFMYPSHATCTGAGCCANVPSATTPEYPERSTRMSMPSSFMASAASCADAAARFLQTSAAPEMRFVKSSALSSTE